MKLTGLSAAVFVVLSACTVSAEAGRTVTAEKIEETAVGALEEKVGRAPEKFECPDDDNIYLKNGETVACVLTDGGSSYDAEVTLSDVDGSKFHLDVQVAQEPRP